MINDIFRTGLMLASEALVGWEPVSSRVITAKFTTKKDIKLNIQCYAPTNNADEERKEEFYQQMQAVMDRGGAKDMAILMGDFSAKIGSNNTGYEDIMWDRWTKMVSILRTCAPWTSWLLVEVSFHMCASTKPHGDPQTTERRIRLTIFVSARCSGDHGGMWGCWEVPTCHQTISWLWQQWGSGSRNNPNSITQTRYNVGLLRNKDTQTAFQISLSNRFQLLQGLIDDSETDLETQWGESKKLWRGMRRSSGQEDGPAQGMDLCWHHVEVRDKEREENCTEHKPDKSSHVKGTSRIHSSRQGSE